jgi:Concanavalin A-like lectin/glucanases superfamily
MMSARTLLLVGALAALPFTTIAQSWLTNGLIAYFPFDGNANDASGNGNDGVVFGATLSVDRFGEPNSCYQFDGVANKILANISNIPTVAQDRTLSVWEKCTANLINAGTYVPAAWGSNAVNRAFGIITQGSPPTVWRIQFWGGGQDVSSAAPIDNNWHLITCVIQSGVAKLYFDGVIKVSGAKSPNTGFSSLCIGTGVETFLSGHTYFPGYVDDVRVYNRALATNEVAELYAIESAPIVKFVKAFTLDYVGLKVGTNYQLQASADLITWTNWGVPFTATSVSYTNTNYQRIDNWNQLFFRLK